ncbi:MAG: sulfotransferase [Candidatus Omnitrophica bacterium]|nr:sulfotransferase [Candidatus Omnitrophota bacterium]MBU1922988.1 sulfotransferase [Candidatus Omnitrophota bacterium]
MELDCKLQSAYIDRVNDFRNHVFEEINKKDQYRLWSVKTLRNVKEAIVISSASRSGSSLLFSLLKKVPQLYSLSGESVPFYKLNGLSSDIFPSDEIPKEVMEKRKYTFGLSRDFLSDFSSGGDPGDIFRDRKLFSQYIEDLTLRFPLQWPQVNFSFGFLKKSIMRAFDIYANNHQIFCKETFYLELLSQLRREYKTINPYYYDIPVTLVKRKFPGLKIPLAPPSRILTIEEPPFILLSPCRKIDEMDLLGKSLLLKSSADCYRMGFIKALLPNARIKIIYLTRNPAASINGLYDGWLHRGFFSHNLKCSLANANNSLSKSLNIRGYSGRHEWGRWWWKYDLPFGWLDYTQSPLEEVCAFQWVSANRALQEYLNKSKKQYLQVKHENIIKNLESRKKEINKILSFIGIRRSAVNQLNLSRLPVIQATSAPKAYRWKKRINILAPLISNPVIANMSFQLGYKRDRIEEWL